MYQLIFLHGFAMYNDPYAEGITTIVEPEGEGVLYNLPGHGVPGARITSGSIGRLTAQICGDLRAGTPIAIAGESLGTAYIPGVLQALERRGAAVRACLLFAPPVMLNSFRIAYWSLETLLRNPRRVFTNRFPIERALRGLQIPLNFTRFSTDLKLQTDVDLQYLLRSLHDVSLLGAKLRSVKVPTLLVQGSRDALLPPMNLRFAHMLCGASIKSAKLIQGAGHSIFWDPHAADAMALARRWIHDHLG